MHYAFDLDGTLGDFHDYMHDYIDIFKAQTSNNSRRKKLDSAYQIFISKIVEKIDLQECTIFNLQMIFLIVKNNVSNAVIYSNNSNPNILNFAKDVIEALLKRPVFCYLMHWNHHFRNNEIVRGDRGNARKTWSVLKKGFLEGCDVIVEPDQVVFYDDQIHPDLVKKLGKNYIHIDDYRTKTNNALIRKLFDESITESGLTNDQPLNEGNFNVLPEMPQDGGRRKRKTNKRTNKKRMPK